MSEEVTPIYDTLSHIFTDVGRTVRVGGAVIILLAFLSLQSYIFIMLTCME
jgi:hypothetical protein